MIQPHPHGKVTQNQSLPHLPIQRTMSAYKLKGKKTLTLQDAKKQQPSAEFLMEATSFYTGLIEISKKDS